jgi:hypothetical protein
MPHLDKDSTEAVPELVVPLEMSGVGGVAKAKVGELGAEGGEVVRCGRTKATP